jgi:hypothetical protein
VHPRVIKNYWIKRCCQTILTVTVFHELAITHQRRPASKGFLLITVWAADFETPVGSSTFFSFFLFLGQHRQK